MIDRRKLVLVGAGMVGMSMAYALVCQGNNSGINEMVLIDVLLDKTIGEAMDLSHGLPYSRSHMEVKAGDYDDCSDADLVVITAGLNQKPGQTRLDLAVANAKIMKEITEKIMASGFNGVIVVASNPVDLMTKVIQEVSGLPTSQVIGSGTALDTARLKYMVGDYLQIASQNVHGYIMGEHGDSSFCPWEQVTVGGQKVVDLIKNDPTKSLDALDLIYDDVKNSAYQIIERKKATYYGIGLGLAKIVQAIMNDSDEIMTVSAYLNGEYGLEDIYIGVPTVINSNGARRVIEINLTDSDLDKLKSSAKILHEYYEQIEKEAL